MYNLDFSKMLDDTDPGAYYPGNLSQEAGDPTDLFTSIHVYTCCGVCGFDSADSSQYSCQPSFGPYGGVVMTGDSDVEVTETMQAHGAFDLTFRTTSWLQAGADITLSPKHVFRRVERSVRSEPGTYHIESVEGVEELLVVLADNPMPNWKPGTGSG